MNNKVLLVYNTCGIKKDNTEWYIKCLDRFLGQKLEDCKIIWSSCLNSTKCFKEIYQRYGDKISYCFHAEPHTVNITFNKAVQHGIEKFGEFEGYFYIDSGCLLSEENDLLEKIYYNFLANNCGILSVQTDTDTGFQGLESHFKNDSQEAQIIGENYIIPLGKAINLHLNVFHNDIFRAYGKIIPDVFAAHCTESTFNYLCASVGKKWAIMKDLIVKHKKSLDGATLCVPHFSAVHRNRWNNLLYGRNALDFVNDEEATAVGLGYEECNQIMMHNPSAYDKYGNSLHPDKLVAAINKFFFLSKNELDYDKIKTKTIP
jgi:hypothetical protein